MAVTPKKQDDELKFRVELAARLATIETKMDANHTQLLTQLQPILQLHDTVQEHDRDISKWKGANAVLGALWLAVVAVIGSLKRIW